MADQRESTAVTRYLYPFQADAGPRCRQVYMGRINPGSGAYAHDPFELYAEGVVTSPNLLMIGDVGSGKTATAKVYLERSMLYGRRGWVIDVKGEYEVMARELEAAGFRVAYVRLDPSGGGVRLNPLDPAVPKKAHLALLRAMAVAAVGRHLEPAEWAAVAAAYQEVMLPRATEPLLGDVVEAMLRPSARQVEAMAARGGADQVHDEGRRVALSLGSLVEHDLAGMFDKPTTRGIDLDAQLVVMDVSALSADPSDEGALAVAMACVTTFLQGQLERQGVDGNLIVLMDEAWRLMRQPATAEWLSAVFKLIRKYGAQVVLVFHRLSDLEAAGESESRQRALVDGLLQDCQMTVIFRQSEKATGLAASALGLTPAERAVLRSLGRGQALWRIGGHSTCVDTVIDPRSWEWRFIDSDAAMRQRTVAL